MFLGLFKHFKIEIMHMLKENGFNEKEIGPLLFAFEKGEISIINAWQDKKHDVAESDYFEEVRKFSEDKNKYLEILNSVNLPIVFFDDSVKPELLNNYAAELFGKLDNVYSYDNFQLPEWVYELAVKFTDEECIEKMDIYGEILFVAIVLDITKTKSIEKELKELNQKLETRVQKEMHKRLKNEKALLEQKKFADMGQLISAIGHQWRQPLNALGLYVQSIRFWYEHGELTNENVREFEKESMELIHSMSSTIDEFRNYFATQEKPETFDIIDVLLNVINIMSSDLASKNIRYSLKCHCSFKKTEFDYEDGCINGCEKGVAFVYGYKDKFRQCLINLITNSMEAIAANNVQKGIIKIEVDAMNPENIIIFIDDNGGGVPQNIINNIFDPYFTTKHEGSGTGLGLSFVKNIIDKHMGGQINFRNTYDGVTFILTLPKKKVDTNAKRF
jgi:signal transduction histidine kinase